MNNSIADKLYRKLMMINEINMFVYEDSTKQGKKLFFGEDFDTIYREKSPDEIQKMAAETFRLVTGAQNRW